MKRKVKLVCLVEADPRVSTGSEPKSKGVLNFVKRKAKLVCSIEVKVEANPKVFKEGQSESKEVLKFSIKEASGVVWPRPIDIFK